MYNTLRRRGHLSEAAPSRSANSATGVGSKHTVIRWRVNHFNNLGGLDEYSTQKKIKWNDWKKIQGHKRSFSQRKVTVSPGDDENKKDQIDQ